MSLLPIIYTSVMIVSVFLFFIIVISYISYKAKTHGRLPRHRDQLDGIKFPISVRPALVNNYSSKAIPMNVQNSIRESNNRHIPKSQPGETRIIQSTPLESQRKNKRNEEERYSNKQHQINHEERYERFNGGQSKRFETQFSKHRLEIMNQSEGFRKTHEKVYDQNVNFGHNSNLNELNLFSYYSDNSELDFVILSADQVSKAV